MRLEDLNDMLSLAAIDMPPAPVQQPENDLHPDPAFLQMRIDDLEMRLRIVEQWAIAMNPTFFQFQKFAATSQTER